MATKPVKKPAVPTSPKAASKATAKAPSPVPVKAATPAAKANPVPTSKTPASATKAVTKPAAKSSAKPAAVKAAPPALKPGARIPGKRGPKPKGNISGIPDVEEIDPRDIETEPVVVAIDPETGEKVKPLRMKLSKAKERALMKEFGLDDTVLSEEDLAKRRLRLKALITLGKTRGYLTHGEISDHLPDKLVDAETLDVVHSLLNDMGVAVYEQTPDAETLLLNNNAPTAASVEEAEEEAEAALSTVDSEFGRTTDPVRMYMREMGTVELLTRDRKSVV